MKRDPAGCRPRTGGRPAHALGLLLGLALLAPVAARADEFAEDFETPPNPRNLMPWGWEQVYDPPARTGPPALPRYNTVFQFAGREAHGGRSAVSFRTLGGDTALRLAAPLPAHPGRAYTLSAWARGTGLEADRLRVELEALDAQGRVLQAAASDPATAPVAWTQLRVTLESLPPKTAAVRPVLRLEGPDVRGEGWFDDVAVGERVRVTVDSGAHVGNLFKLGEPVTYTLRIHGADDGPLEVQRTVEAPDGEVVVPRARLAAGAAEGGVVPVEDTYTMDRAGYFEARVQVLRAGKLLAERAVPVGVLADLGAPPGLGDFGVACDPGGVPPPRIHLDALLARGGLRRIKLPLPPVGEGPRDEALDDLTRLVAQRFAQQRVELIGILQAAPPAGGAADAAAPEQTLSARLRQGRVPWLLALATVIRDYSGDIKVFQLGTDDDVTVAGAEKPDELLRRARNVMSQVLTFGTYGLPAPWPAADRAPLREPPFFFAFDGRGGRAGDPPPAWIAVVPDRRLTLRLAAADGPDRADARRAQVADLARRAVEAKRHGWPTLYFAPLYGVPSAMLDAEGFPTPAFHAWRTLDALLSGAAYEAPAFAYPDVESLRFSRDGECIIALWAAGAPAVKELWLGPDVRAVSLDGRVRPLPPGSTLRIDGEPLFLLGVNPWLPITHRSITVEPDVLDLREHAQPFKIVLRNRFPQPMKDVRIGRIRDANGQWIFTPAGGQTSLLGPEKAFELPLSVRLPNGETPGTRELIAEVHFTADKEYTTLVSLPVRIVSPFELAVSADPAAAGAGRKAVVVVTNRHEPTGKPEEDAGLMLQFRLSTILPGGTPQDEYVKLLPGGTFTARYPLPAGVAGSVVATVRETRGDHYLTRSAVVP